MSREEELLSMARDHERALEEISAQLWLEEPGRLRKQLRSDLARQVDLKRIKRSDDDVVTLKHCSEIIAKLACPGIKFASDSSLDFRLELERKQEGWLLKRFEYNLRFSDRGIGMVRIHLNERSNNDPLAVPRCHLHVDSSKPHIPFPVMSPRLMVHMICEHIEPNFCV